MDKSRDRLADWLLAALWLLATGRLRLTGWTESLALPQALAFGGLALGLLLGRSRFGRWGQIFFLLAYSALALPWALLTQQPGADSAWTQLLNLSARLLAAWGQFLARQPVQDPLLFLLFISALNWLLALFSGFAWARRRAFLAATLPPALLLLTVQLYDPYIPARMWFLAFFLVFWLVLLARHTYAQRQALHLRQGMADLPDNLADVYGQAVLLAVTLIWLAWLLPPLAEFGPRLERGRTALTSWWQTVEDRLENAVAPLKSSAPGTAQDAYGATMSLGRGISLSQDLLFTVTADQPPPLRYYWRGYAYDAYENGVWYRSTGRTDPFFPEKGQLPLVGRVGGSQGFFRITYQQPGRLLYALPGASWVGRAAFVDHWPLTTPGYDISAWRAQTPLFAGETYALRAWLREPSVAELRTAGSLYPDWVRQRYLQLPEDFSPRLQALAETLAADQPTPYDVAAAITDYLRREVAYRDSLDIPPEVDDPLAWAILDARQGFCNYYASAEVLMLRSLGIPARLGVGFSQGESEDGRTFFVRRLNAHAWPEVYFPGYGWVIFEPTAGQPPLVRPAAPLGTPTPRTAPPPRRTPPAPLPLESETPAPPAVPAAARWTPPPWLWAAVGLLALLGLMWAGRRGRWVERLPLQLAARRRQRGRPLPAWLTTWERWAQASPVERAAHWITLGVCLAAGRNPAPLTPYEQAALLRPLLPERAAAIDQLTALWVRQIYGNSPPEFPRKTKQLGIIISKGLFLFCLQHPRTCLLHWRKGCPDAEFQSVIDGS